MNGKHEKPSEQDFEARLKRAQDASKNRKSSDNIASRQTGKGLAFRIGTELVVAVIVGGFIGFILDSWLNTKPWFIIIFLFLGNAAGLWNIFRLSSNQGYGVGFRYRKRR